MDKLIVIDGHAHACGEYLTVAQVEKNRTTSLMISLIGAVKQIPSENEHVYLLKWQTSWRHYYKLDKSKFRGDSIC